MQIAAWAPELSCRARRSDCRLQAANAACRGLALAVFVREIRRKRPLTPQNTQGPGPSADPRLQMQIAARGGEGSCRGCGQAADPRLQIRFCSTRGEGSCGLRTGLQIQIANADCSSGERGAAGLGTGSADSRLQIQIAARDREGRCRGTGPVCRSQIANTDCSTQPRGGLQRQG